MKSKNHKVVKATKKLIHLLIGIPLLIIGIILIPLPGPGLVITFIAVFILSREFTYFEKLYSQTKKSIEKIIKEAVKKHDEFLEKYDKPKDS